MQSILKHQDLYNLLTGRTPQLFNKVLNRNFKEHDINLTREQWSVLALLWKDDGSSQQELADKSFRSRPSVTRLVDNLEKDGWVLRVPDAQDRRQNLVFLTPKGKNIEHRVLEVLSLTVRQAINNIDEEEVEKVKDILDRIFMNLE